MEIDRSFEDFLADISAQDSVLFCGAGYFLQDRLCRKYPGIHIECLSRDEQRICCEEGKFFRETAFDYIIAGDLLNKTAEPETLAICMRKHLKETGMLLCAFANSQYWQRLCGEQDIEMPVGWSVAEMGMLFQNAGWQDIAVGQIFGAAPTRMLAELQQQGYTNEHRELETMYWTIRVYRMKPETAWLRQFYTAEVRQQLAYILRRIENDIEAAENIEKLWSVCGEMQISGDYLLRFMHNVLLSPAIVLQRLSRGIEGENHG